MVLSGHVSIYHAVTASLKDGVNFSAASLSQQKLTRQPGRDLLHSRKVCGGYIMKSKMAFAAVASALLSSCVTAEQAAQIYGSQTTASPAVKAAIVEYVRNTFFDPYSIRDAEISNRVKLGTTGLDAVCFKANAKNRMGGYIGRKAVSVRIKDEKVVSWVEDAPGCMDPRLKYDAFPQLENL